MLDVEIQFDDINVSNIEKKDLPQLYEWMQLENQFINEENNIMELQERFLESYISECEFFLKINKKNSIIGTIKGRLEFKNPNEVWIWFFYVNNKYRTTDLSSKIIIELMDYFFQEYGIDIFFARLIKDDEENLKLWKKMGFKTIRMVKNFYSIDGKFKDMLIMKKTDPTSNKFMLF